MKHRKRTKPSLVGMHISEVERVLGGPVWTIYEAAKKLGVSVEKVYEMVCQHPDFMVMDDDSGIIVQHGPKLRR